MNLHFLPPDSTHPRWRLEEAPDEVLLTRSLLREAAEGNPLAGWRMTGPDVIAFETPQGLNYYDLQPADVRWGERRGQLRHDDTR